MTERLQSPLLTAYGLAGRAMMPLVPMLLSYRTGKGKEDPKRRAERYGQASQPRPPGPIVWVHAASVGETNAVLPVVRRIVEAGIGVVFTTVTVTSAVIAARELPQGAVHQYAPLDIVPYVDRFLDHWRPGLALFVESELWPTTMARLATRNIAEIRLNARMSPRSFGRWQSLGGATRPLFAGVELALAQSEDDAGRLRALGLASARSVGNLKFDVPAPSADAAALDAFGAMVAGREIFVAASTHEGEEAIVAAAHREVRSRRPHLLSIIVPRHPVRGPALHDMLATGGLSVGLRSRSEPVTPDMDLYIADTLGELGLFYRVADVALVGGTLVPVGGHNPIEAALLDNAVLHGPHVQNAAQIYAALDAETGLAPIADAAGLASSLDALLADPDARRDAAGRAAAVLAPFTGALDATMAALSAYLERLISASPQTSGQPARRIG